MTSIRIVPISAPTSRIMTANGPIISAQTLTITPTDCDQPCNVAISVKWKNIGEDTGSFIPAIIVNGTRYEKPIETLVKNQIVTKVFNLTNLMAGIYTVCPDPN